MAFAFGYLQGTKSQFIMTKIYPNDVFLQEFTLLLWIELMQWIHWHKQFSRL